MKLHIPWFRIARPAFRREKALRYVVDQAHWAIYWIGQYLTNVLRTEHALPARIERRVRTPRGQLLHFGDRYQFLDCPSAQLAEANDLFVTWYHGHADDPEFRPQFQQLVDRQSDVRKIVTTCTISFQQLVRAGISPERVELIPLGVDTRRFVPAQSRDRARARRRLGVPPDAWCIGSFQKDGAGWADGDEPKWIKGPEVFLDVVQRVAGQVPNVFVLLTGPARGYVKNGLARRGIPFAHYPLRRYHDLVACYHALDVYLITSRTEGGPLSLLEAWSCGIPVVSTRMGMPADVVRHAVNGLLAEVGDRDGLASAVVQLHDDSTCHNTLRQSALQCVKDFDWSVIGRHHYNRLYRDCLYRRYAA